MNKAIRQLDNFSYFQHCSLQDEGYEKSKQNRSLFFEEPILNRNELFKIANRNLLSQKNDSNKGKEILSSNRSQQNKYSSNGSQNGVNIQQQQQSIHKIQLKNTQIQQGNQSQQNNEESGQKYICETKNVIKNFGRAILSNIIKSGKFYKKLIQKEDVNYGKFMKDIRRYKKRLATIASLRALWLEGQNSYAKLLRILSFQFLRKHSLKYIFNSRIKHYQFNIRYRRRLFNCVANPNQFTYLKE